MIARRAQRLSDKIMRKTSGMTPKDASRLWEKITLKRRSLLPPAPRRDQKN
jgi:hypothetical protein